MKLQDLLNKVKGVFGGGLIDPSNTGGYNFSGPVASINGKQVSGMPVGTKPFMGQSGTPAVASPTPTVTPAPKNLQDLSARIQAGLTKWGNGTAPPVATMSGSLAEAGQNLPDPLLPAILALKESRGGQDAIPAKNANPYNIFYPGTQKSVDYNGVGGLKTAILGGNGKLGFAGLLRPGGIYSDYLNSGNLSDFFSHYSPPGQGNAAMEEQLRQYNVLKSYFQ